MNRVGTRFIGTAASLVVWAHVMAAMAGEPQAQESLVRIEKVQVLLSAAGPVVLLEAQHKAIPVFVDFIVAESIQGALSGQKPRRPLSHDLMHTILAALEARVSQVIITLKGDTYYADLTVVARDKSSVFDSRSSDAIALAIHFKAPILVSQALIDSAGVEIPKPKEQKL